MKLLGLAPFAVMLLLWAVSALSAGDIPCRPLYEVDLPYQPEATGSVLTDYMTAYRSKTTVEGLKRWEKFAETHIDESLSRGMEDLTSMILLRQASYELARLYYLMGFAEQGDKSILAAEGMIAYTMPTKEQGRAWCRAHKFCDIALPGYVLRPAPGSDTVE